MLRQDKDLVLMLMIRKSCQAHNKIITKTAGNCEAKLLKSKLKQFRYTN